MTKWMSVPWHTDTASCRSGYDATFDLYIPTFWPTVSPNHVLTEEDYNVVIDETQSAEVRSAAFNNRPDWLRHIARPNQRDSLQLMLTKWFRLAIVTERPGPTIGDFPASMLVETGLAFTDPRCTTLTRPNGIHTSDAERGSRRGHRRWRTGWCHGRTDRPAGRSSSGAGP